ncbi:MAG: Ankyrin [Chitinophagaceae bacterium]|nr:Ankyrin [Chitinophagaceae bacterium]
MRVLKFYQSFRPEAGYYHLWYPFYTINAQTKITSLCDWCGVLSEVALQNQVLLRKLSGYMLKINIMRNQRRFPEFNSFFILVTVLTAALFAQKAEAQQSSLLAAVKNNNIKEVKLLLDKGADPNACDDDSDNVLINAALYASVDCMKLLLEGKANPNLKNKLGQTPMMFCTHEAGKMKLLFQYGADINAKSNSGNTPLLIACMGNGQFENIKWLVDKGADPLARNQGKETSLMRAAQFGDTMTIHLLIGRGVEVNASAWGFTALMYAVRFANWPSVFSLLVHGADPDIADNINMLPVLWAAELDNIDAVNALLKKTKDINRIDSLAGMTPLMWATYNEHDNPQIIQALLDKGALVNIRAKNGSTALSWAMKKGNTATVALLKKAGAQQ